jgi:hypothetical protein
MAPMLMLPAAISTSPPLFSQFSKAPSPDTENLSVKKADTDVRTIIQGGWDDY